MKTLRPGAKARYRVVPTLGDTPAAEGLEDARVVSTPRIVAFAEHACHLAIADCYDPGETSVGSQVEIEHCAPALPGAVLDCEAELTGAEGSRATFRFSVRQSEVLVARGTHRRVFVSAARFVGTASSGAEITFWFDFHSPWCHIAAARIGRVAARYGRRLRWRPLHLANLIDMIGGRRPLEENNSFVRWFKQDMQDWAAIAGVTVRYHPHFPLRPARALRMALYAAERGDAAPFVRAVMKAYWADSRDISDLEVLAGLAAQADLSAAESGAAATDSRRKEELARNTAEAAASGVFGVPAMVTDGKLFFGNDRIEMLGDWLTAHNERPA